MAFVSNFLIRSQRHKNLQQLPAFIRRTTAQVIETSKIKVGILMQPEQNLNQQNALNILKTIDSISNDCCEVADSCSILYRQYAPFTISADLQEAVTTSSNEIQDFFNSEHLNLNVKLLTLLESINNQFSSTLDPVDLTVLTAFIKFLTQQQKCGYQVQQIQSEVQHLHRLFQQNIARGNQSFTLTLTKNQISSIPNRQFQSLFEKVEEDQEVRLTGSEFQLLKVSRDADLRSIFFNQFSQSCISNLQPLTEMLALRRDLARNAKFLNFFDMQIDQQQLRVAKNSVDLLQKIDKIKKEIQPLARRDLKTIKRITGLKNIRYEDLVFLKRQIRETILSKDSDNIQMLKCFTLHNALRGLCLLIKKISKNDFNTSTIVLDQLTGEIIEEKKDIFDFSHLAGGQSTAKTVLFKIEIEGAGSIIMDLFQREGAQVRLAQVQNISTITERSSSLLKQQSGVAYLIANLPREDIQYLSFEQVKLLFHEFGHSLNISLSNTKYQYLAGARGTTDIIEIPSHFTELYLNDYQFVRQFAQLPLLIRPQDDLTQQSDKDWRMFPIKRQVFEKMMFCDQVFDWIELEESLYFTSLDVEFHSAHSQPYSQDDLYSINLKHISQMTVNEKCKESILPSNPPTESELEQIISESQNQVESQECFKRISEILFTESDDSEYIKAEFNPDQEKISKIGNNPLFCRFHHLFEYEATYYSYLIAKLSSKRLFYKENAKRSIDTLSDDERALIFTKPGETTDYLKQILM